MRRVLLATLLLSVLGAADASAACHATRFRFNLGAEANTWTNMLVSSGKRCSILLHAGSRSAFSSFAVSAPPQHGTARIDGGAGAVYQSRPGYRGEDSFSFAVSGTGAHGSGKTTIRVAVTVQ
jgi:hypothetical protein